MKKQPKFTPAEKEAIKRRFGVVVTDECDLEAAEALGGKVPVHRCTLCGAAATGYVNTIAAIHRLCDAGVRQVLETCQVRDVAPHGSG